MSPERPAGRDEQRPRRGGGFTLVELVITIAVMGVALAGTLLAMNATSVHVADPMLRHQAVSIGEAYLEEILLNAYLDPDTGDVCPAAEASRSLYDNLCDYDGLDDAGARDQNDAAIALLSAYRVRVAVDSSATLDDLSGSTQVLRVDVRVTHPALVDLTLSGYRSAY